MINRLRAPSFVLSLAFSPNGRLLVSGSFLAGGNRGGINLWDVVSGKELKRLEWESGVSWVSFSPDGRLLAARCCDGTIRLCEVPSAKEIASLKYADFDNMGMGEASGCFSPDGRVLACGAHDSCRHDVVLWEVLSGKEIARLCSKQEAGSGSIFYEAIAFSPDGRLLASGTTEHSSSSESPIQNLIIWDVLAGTQVCSLGYQGKVSSVSFSPNGKLLATGSWDNLIRLWEVSSWREITCLKAGTMVNCVGFSPDGRILASGSLDKTLRIWDVSSGREVQRIKEHNESVASVSFSPDGSLLVSGDYDCSILIFKPALSLDKVLNHFKQVGQVDAQLVGEMTRDHRERGKLQDLAEALQNEGFFEEAAKIYEDLGQAPTKSKSQSAQRPKESEPTSREADPSTKSVCPSCDAEVKPNWLECPECGASLKEIVCQNCGEPLERHWTRCPVCRGAILKG